MRQGRTVLLAVVQTLAAYRLAKLDEWEQLFTDATTRRQITFQNISIAIKDDHDLIKLLLLTTLLIPEIKTADTVCQAIVDAMRESALLLYQWRSVHESMFRNRHNVPPADSLPLGKLGKGGVVNTDTCATAQKIARLLFTAIIEKTAEEKGYAKINGDFKCKINSCNKDFNENGAYFQSIKEMCESLLTFAIQ